MDHQKKAKENVEYVLDKLSQRGYYNIEVHRAEMNERLLTLEISFKWKLNAWDKFVSHHKIYCVWRDGDWEILN